MKIFCNECQHTKVCKHKQKYVNAIDSMDAISIPAPFELELKCPHYSANLSMYYCGTTYSGLQNAIDCSSTTATYNSVEATCPKCSED